MFQQKQHSIGNILFYKYMNFGEIISNSKVGVNL